jgi:hypothetical protein
MVETAHRPQGLVTPMEQAKLENYDVVNAEVHQLSFGNLSDRNMPNRLVVGKNNENRAIVVIYREKPIYLGTKGDFQINDIVSVFSSALNEHSERQWQNDLKASPIKDVNVLQNIWQVTHPATV